MKQPQLGKKITELRQAKGLTQTELAEECNISLRTIQRVESTEVTPRSYTLKLIFKTLDFDGFNSLDKNTLIKSTDKIESKMNLAKTIFLILATAIISITIFKLIINSRKQDTMGVVKIIKKNQLNIKKWMNNKQVDSVLTMYGKNACVLNVACGKTQILEMMNNIVSNDYELIKYTSMSINVSGTIAVEKYKNTYSYKGKVRSQIGVAEWHFQEGKWCIINDVFRD